MAPLWVPVAARRPHKCAFIPFIGGYHPEGFFDPGMDMPTFDGRPYVSVVAAKQMAERMGWVPGGANPLARKVNELEGEVARLTAQLAEAEKFRESAQHFARGIGQPPIPPRKTGRPKGKVPA